MSQFCVRLFNAWLHMDILSHISVTQRHNQVIWSDIGHVLFVSFQFHATLVIFAATILVFLSYIGKFFFR